MQTIILHKLKIFINMYILIKSSLFFVRLRSDQPGAFMKLWDFFYVGRLHEYARIKQTCTMEIIDFFLFYLYAQLSGNVR